MQNEICLCNGDKLSSVNQIIYLCSVVPFTVICSIILSSMFVEKYIWRPYVKKSLLETNDIDFFEEPVVPEIYTEKYLFDDNIDDEPERENYDNLTVLESTPHGNVIMNYYKKDEIWQYWVDKKHKNNITYDELDTVCRKFCKTYNCKCLYIDKKKDIEEQKQEIKRKKENEEMKREDQQIEKEVNSDDELFVKAKISTNKKTKTSVICARKSNKYKYMGSMSEFPAFNIKREIKNETKELGWLAWKTASR